MIAIIIDIVDVMCHFGKNQHAVVEMLYHIEGNIGELQLWQILC